MYRVTASEDPSKVDGLLIELNGDLKKNANDRQARWFRANCYKTKGQYNEACQDVSRLIADGPLWPDYVLRSAIYQKQGNKQKAEEDLKKAKQLGYDPDRMRMVIQTRHPVSLPNSTPNSEPMSDRPVD